MASSVAARLPFIDELSTEIAAPPERVFETVRERMAGSAPGPVARGFAAMLGVEDVEPVLGFRVAHERPADEYVLEGAHRFSRYRLGFQIDPLGPERVRLRARTEAEFPGPHGTVYRTLVIGSGGHRVMVRRMLAQVKRAAERT